MKSGLSILSILLIAHVAFAQKATTLLGDAWKGVIESADEATREIKIVNPDKAKETFTGVLMDGYQAKMKDGTMKELKMSDFQPGLHVRLWYKSKIRDIGGQETKVNLINRVQFLGQDEYTRLRELLKVDHSLPVTVADSQKLVGDPLKLYLSIQPKNLRESMVEWADQWNKKHSAKHWRVELVDDPAKSDASLIVIWGEDDSYLKPEIQAHRLGDMVSTGPSTASAQVTIYLTTHDENGVKLLWQRSRMIVVFDKRVDVPIVVRDIQNKLKDLHD